MYRQSYSDGYRLIAIHKPAQKASTPSGAIARKARRINVGRRSTLWIATDPAYPNPQGCLRLSGWTASASLAVESGVVPDQRATQQQGPFVGDPAGCTGRGLVLDHVDFVERKRVVRIRRGDENSAAVAGFRRRRRGIVRDDRAREGLPAAIQHDEQAASEGELLASGRVICNGAVGDGHIGADAQSRASTADESKMGMHLRYAVVADRGPINRRVSPGVGIDPAAVQCLVAGHGALLKQNGRALYHDDPATPEGSLTG